MSTTTTIPAVLQQPNGNSLSLERTLNHAIDLLTNVVPLDNSREDEVIICIDDLITIRNHLER